MSGTQIYSGSTSARPVLNGGTAAEANGDRSDLRTAPGEAEAMLEAILSASPDIITLVRPDGQRTPPNQAIRAVLGYDPVAFAAIDGMSLIHPEDRRRVTEAFRSVLDGGNPAELRYRMLHA